MLQQKFTVQVTTLSDCDDITRFDGTVRTWLIVLIFIDGFVQFYVSRQYLQIFAAFFKRGIFERFCKSKYRVPLQSLHSTLFNTASSAGPHIFHFAGGVWD
jgi:hypothetical protein